MHDQRQRIDLVTVDQNVQLHQVRRLVAIEMIVQRRIAATGGLQTIEEVQNHFVHRQVVGHLDLSAEEQHVVLNAALLDAQRYDVAQVLLRHKDIRPHDRFAHVFDSREVWQLRRVVDVNGFTGLEQ